MDFIQKYRDAILLVWGLCMLTAVVFFHIVVNPYVYFILGAAVGVPVFLGLSRNGKKKP